MKRIYGYGIRRECPGAIRVVLSRPNEGGNLCITDSAARKLARARCDLVLVPDFPHTRQYHLRPWGAIEYAGNAPARGNSEPDGVASVTNLHLSYEQQKRAQAYLDQRRFAEECLALYHEDSDEGACLREQVARIEGAIESGWLDCPAFPIAIAAHVGNLADGRTAERAAKTAAALGLLALTSGGQFYARRVTGAARRRA